MADVVDYVFAHKPTLLYARSAQVIAYPGNQLAHQLAEESMNIIWCLRREDHNPLLSMLLQACMQCRPGLMYLVDRL